MSKDFFNVGGEMVCWGGMSGSSCLIYNLPIGIVSKKAGFVIKFINKNRCGLHFICIFTT